MIKGCILDIDNTIFSYDDANKIALEHTLTYIKNKYNFDEFTCVRTYKKIQEECKISNNNALKHNKIIYFKKLIDTLHLPLGEVLTVTNLYNTTFTQNIKIYDHFEDFLSIIHLKKIKVCALSNNNCRDQLERIQKLNILDKFNFIVTSEELGEEKPLISTFLHCLYLLELNSTNVCFIGDNIKTDIIPSLELKMLPFHFNTQLQYDGIRLVDKYIEFSSYKHLSVFVSEMHSAIDNFEYLSHLFGQSSNFVQGGGGNISVKLCNNQLLLIKSSGMILGNVTTNTGYCILDNNKLLYCLDSPNDENLKITDSQLIKHCHVFGEGIGSIESFFHSVLKKYTVHLHMSLVNIFLTQTNFDEFNQLRGFDLNKYLCKYLTPGKMLSIYLNNELKKNKFDIDVIFLLNHGIIITSNEINDIINILEYTQNYFINKCDIITQKIFEPDCFTLKITKIIKQVIKKNSVVYNSRLVFDPVNFFPIIYCFPDLAVFADSVPIKTTQITFEKDLITYLEIHNKEPNIIFLDDYTFIVADTLQKCYSIEQIFEAYNIYMSTNKQNNVHVSEINDFIFLQNWDSEKYRKI